MVVVSDTSPLSNLAIIGRLDLLRGQFEVVLVPSAVRQELSRLRHPAAAATLATAFRDGWLRVVLLEDAPPSRVATGLHTGEAEAMALGLERNADLVLLDDGDARRRAAEIGLSFTGALGVLLRARQGGHIDSLQKEIQRLRAEAHFFIAKTLEAELLIAAGEPPTDHPLS